MTLIACGRFAMFRQLLPNGFSAADIWVDCWNIVRGQWWLDAHDVLRDPHSPGDR